MKNIECTTILIVIKSKSNGFAFLSHTRYNIFKVGEKIMKIFEIDLYEEEDLFEKYNKKIVSQELIDYIVDAVYTIDLKDPIKIVINNNIKTNQECVPIIIQGLKKEYNKTILEYKHNNNIQLIYFIAGILILLASVLIKNVILSEISLIGAWVLIWSMIEIEIFTDIKNKRKSKILKKIIESDIQELRNNERVKKE